GAGAPSDQHPPEVDKPAGLLSGPVVLVLDLCQLGARPVRGLDELVLVRLLLAVVDPTQQIARDREQPLHRDAFARAREDFADAYRKGLARVKGVADLGGVSRPPSGRPMEADVRPPAPEKPEDAFARLLRECDRRGLAGAPVGVDDWPVLRNETPELRSKPPPGRPVQLALVVQRVLMQVVGPHELRKSDRLRSRDLVAPSGNRTLECDRRCRRSAA